MASASHLRQEAAGLIQHVIDGALAPDEAIDAIEAMPHSEDTEFDLCTAAHALMHYKEDAHSTVSGEWTGWGGLYQPSPDGQQINSPLEVMENLAVEMARQIKRTTAESRS